MVRPFVVAWLLLLALAAPAWCQNKPPADKPIITLVLPSAEALFEDMEFVFNLAQDPAGFKTLKETTEVFLVGVDPKSVGGIRVFPVEGELRYILSLPVTSEKEFAELRAQFWDVDLRTVPPPEAALLRQVPAAIRTAATKAQLTKNERQMYSMYAGFMRFDPADKQVHIGETLADVRRVKGGVPAGLLNGRDVAVLIDGTLMSPADRRAGFAKSKKEVLAAIVKGDKEEPSAFELRKALTEQQIEEVERFFADSSKIDMGWTTSSQDRTGVLAIDLAAVEGTSLAESVKLLGQAPDDFAGVSSEGTVLHGSVNFPLDELRKASLTKIAKLAREHCKVSIDGNAKLSSDLKKTDKDLAELMFDVLDGIAHQGVFNGFARVWSNGDGTLTIVGGTKVPDGGKFVAVLEKFGERGGDAKLDAKADSEGNVDIHKLTLAGYQKEYAELLGKDAEVYIGTSANAVWLASGEKALERLKKAIQEVTAAGPKPGPVIELKAQLLPLIDVVDKVRTRQKPEQANPPAPKAGEKEKRDGDTREKAQGILADLQIRKVALEAFKQGKDTLSLSLTREESGVKLKLQIDEGILRFIGKALSKIVKENLAD